MSASRARALSAWAILAEVAGAIIGGIVIAPLAAILVGFLFMGAGLGMGLLSVQVFAAVAGFGAGAGVGAALAGRAMGQRGTWWLGSALGVATAAAVILVMRLLQINAGGLLGILWVGAPLTLIAAVAGYNLRRRP
jgi:hypothetical protein